MKVFISQRFRDKTKEEIESTREKIKDAYIRHIAETTDISSIYGTEWIESWHPENYDKNSIYLLGDSIKELSKADLVLLPKSALMNVDEFVHHADNSTVKHSINISNLKGCELELLISFTYGKKYLFYYENGGEIKIKDDIL